jgi:hypothetical protein
MSGLLILQKGDVFIRYFKMCIPVGVNPSLPHSLFRYLVGDLLAGYTGKIDFTFDAIRFDHDHTNQVFIDGSIKMLHTKGAKEINPFAFQEMKIGMFNAGIISNLRMQKKQTFFSSRVADLEHDEISNPQMSPAMRTNIMIIHDLVNDWILVFTSYDNAGLLSINSLYLLYQTAFKMDKKNISSYFGIILASGSVWGLAEFAAGLGLQKCATLITGAVLTGISFFWLSFIWSATKRMAPVLMIVAIAILFKWLDALLLQVAWNHGSIMNPMFAFITAMVGFFLVAGIFRNRFSKSPLNRILAGGGAALVATCMFPLVKFATGIPACSFAATNIPLAIYTAPVAIAIAMVTVPLGYRAASWYNGEERQMNQVQPSNFLTRLWSPAVFLGCVLVVVLVRLI